jgi:fructokinase
VPLRIGIDLGGTKIEGIVLDGSREAARLRVDTPRGDYGATLGAIAGAVDALERRTATGATVGIGIPGTISPSTGLVKNANSAWLIGEPLQTDLERLLERPVRVANDANCFAISEATDGAAEGADVVFGVIVGTGVGGGITVKGRIISGPNRIAGEWGHNPLPWPDRRRRSTSCAIAANRGASKRFFPDRDFPPITRLSPVFD